MKSSRPIYLLEEEDRKRIDQMLSLIHLFVTELVEHRRLPLEIKDDSAFEEFEAYLERLAAKTASGIDTRPDF